jgi:hypothetical protein
LVVAELLEPFVEHMGAGWDNMTEALEPFVEPMGAPGEDSLAGAPVVPRPIEEQQQ